jgi:hypothetical protein
MNNPAIAVADFNATKAKDQTSQRNYIEPIAFGQLRTILMRLDPRPCSEYYQTQSMPFQRNQDVLYALG